MRRAVRATRHAISPRLAIRIRSNIAALPRRASLARMRRPAPDAFDEGADESPQLGQQPDRKQHQHDDQRERHEGIGQRQIDETAGEQVLTEGRHPIRDRLGRGIDDGTRSGLGEVAAGSQRAADDRRGDGPSRRRIAEYACRQRCTRGDANDGVDEIPHRVEARNLVRKKLDEDHEAGRREHHRMRQDLQMLRQIEPAGVADRADDEQHGVQTDSAGPAERSRERDQLPGVKAIHRHSSRGTHAALRLARNAATPSLPSADARTEAMRSAVSAIRVASIGRCATARNSVLHSDWASGPALSSRPSTSSMRSSSSAGTARSCKRPRRNASAAVNRSAVKNSRRAARAPIASTTYGLIVAGMSPRRASDNAKTASGVPIAISQQAMRPIPPPNAAPWTRAIVGLGSSFNVVSIAASAFASARFCVREKPAIFFIQFRSAPAQKLAPAPISTTARTAVSTPSRCSAELNSAISVSLNALWTSGRLSVTTAMPAPTATAIVVYLGAAAGFAVDLRLAVLLLTRALAMAGYIRNTPNVVGSMGLFSAAEIASPSTRRVSAGSMTPSSQSRALA